VHAWKHVRAAVIATAVAALAAAGSVAVATPAASAASGKINKTVVTWAEKPGQAPNYIFPFLTVAYNTVPNGDEFDNFMYRPLYWYGKDGKPVLNQALSLAELPQTSNGGKTFKITLKTYEWSNGTKVTSTDVLFWMNIWHQKPTNFAGWFSGGLSMPTSVTSFTVTSPTTFTINFDRSFNPQWILSDQLASIVPLPLAWTRTSLTAAAGSAHCATAPYGTADAACKAVYSFLSQQSGLNPTNPSASTNALSTYATNPLWQVVDGPWKLKSFSLTAPIVMVPNPKYSGPNKPTYKEFIEEPFATASAEYAALVTGKIDVSYYIPRTEVTSPAKAPSKPTQTLEPGRNNLRLVRTYSLEPVYEWGFNAIVENQRSTANHGIAGALLRQLYVRQALQLLITQKLYIDRLEKGYGVPDYGAVPIWPRNPYSSAYEASNPYPYSPGHARALLKAHGWRVVPGGVSTCSKPGAGPGRCGAGIPAGAKFEFTMRYASGTVSIKDVTVAEQSSWEEAGIRMNLIAQSFDTIVGSSTPCPHGCAWQFAAVGLGWDYSGATYPTGQELFAKDAQSNYPSFTTPTVNKLIQDTITVKSTKDFTEYENLIAKKLPDIWQPQVVTVAEIRKGIAHPPLSPLDNTTPATLHWK